MIQRIIEIRKKNGLNQEQFAQKIGMSRSFINQVEVGKRNLSDRTIADICREFNVSETWLRTGKGEMFAPEPEFDLAGYIVRHKMSEMETEILKAYLELAPNVREGLIQHFKERLATKTDSGEDIPVPTGPERTEVDIAAELAELKRQNQELAAEIAAIKGENALLGLTGGFSSGEFSPVEGKKNKPTPISEDELTDDEKFFMKHVDAMSPGQQEIFFQHYKQMYLMREQQKDTSAAFASPAHSDKASESEPSDRS